MTAHPATLRLPPPERLGAKGAVLRKVLLIVAIIGAVLSLIGALTQHRQFAYSWFFGFYYFFTIALGALFWVLLHYVCNAGWDVLIRRIWENLIALLPWLLLIFAPLLLVEDFRNTLWTWMGNQSAHEVVVRSGYVNLPFFFIRLVVYFAFFFGAGHYYRSSSIKQDVDGSPVWTYRMHIHSYFLMVVFAVFETFAAFDWFMSMYWRWSSSLFGVYNFAVCAQAGMAACIVILAWLKAQGFLARVNAEHYQLAGKLLFGFSIFWAYIAFGQFLLIWYANIPEETIFYNDHNRENWIYITFFMMIGKFMFPVIYLLSQDLKRTLRGLAGIALWILFMHAVELYWFIMPYAHRETIIPSWLDIVAWVTIGSFLGWVYLRIAASASLFPVRDPRLAESLTVTN